MCKLKFSLLSIWTPNILTFILFSWKQSIAQLLSDSRIFTRLSTDFAKLEKALSAKLCRPCTGAKPSLAGSD